jgi:hypothetical protein
MLKRIISAVTIVSIMLTSVLLPANQALAERRILSEKSLESGKRTPVYDPKMIEGDFRITRADEAAVILDIPSSQTTDEIIRFSGNSPIVWARYNPNDARGRIDITRIERTSRDTVRLIIEPFRPVDGKRWSDFTMGYLPIYFHGINPFDNFRGPDDGLWHNINQGAFLAAVGMAQQNTRAHFSFTALASVRQDVQTSTSGGFFRKRVSTAGLSLTGSSGCPSMRNRQTRLNLPTASSTGRTGSAPKGTWSRPASRSSPSTAGTCRWMSTWPTCRPKVSPGGRCWRTDFLLRSRRGFPPGPLQVLTRQVSAGGA